MTYELSDYRFVTPHGHHLTMTYRLETNDSSVALSECVEAEQLWVSHATQ